MFYCTASCRTGRVRQGWGETVSSARSVHCAGTKGSLAAQSKSRPKTTSRRRCSGGDLGASVNAVLRREPGFVRRQHCKSGNRLETVDTLQNERGRRQLRAALQWSRLKAVRHRKYQIVPRCARLLLYQDSDRCMDSCRSATLLPLSTNQGSRC